MKTKTVILIIISAIMALLLLFGGLGYFGYRYYQSHLSTVAIHTIGDKEITVDVGTEYKDQGAAAVVSSEAEGARRIDVATAGNVDTNTVGTYILAYTAVFDGTQYTDNRIVHVVDRVAPELKAGYSGEAQRTWMDEQAYYWYEAIDNYDGDITDMVKIKEEGNRIKFTVYDRAGNHAEAELKALVDIEEPVILFPGNTSLITGYVGEDVDIPNAIALDGMDNDLSAYIRTEGSYDGGVPGTYKIRYYIKNAMGETVEATRTIIIRQRLNTNQPANPNKVIYLTFNGGPDINTEANLNILEKYNVKATFFIGGWNEGYRNLIARMKSGGHTVGVYSNTRNWGELYQTVESFKEDFAKVQKVVESATGSQTAYMRFPGGSVNGIGASDYVMSRLRSDYAAGGYRYFDWTIDPYDTGSSSEQVYSFVISSVAAGAPNIIAFNDSSTSTRDALENIILWGLREGYTFMPLS